MVMFIMEFINRVFSVGEVFFVLLLIRLIEKVVILWNINCIIVNIVINWLCYLIIWVLFVMLEV